jgi:transposase
MTWEAAPTGKRGRQPDYSDAAIQTWSSPGFVDTFWLSYEGVHMPRTRNPYPADFRDQIIALARAGRSVESLAREFEPCAATIAGWIRQAGIDSGARDDGPTSLEREELARLRKENRQLRMERDILSKAAAWFARDELGSSRSSSS